MVFNKRTNKETDALEKLTVREVSQEYYEANRKNRAQILIHGHYILLFRCSKCGRCFEYRDDLRHKVLEEYEKNLYCRDCWEKEQHLIQVTCHDCGRPITLFESRNRFNGLCRDC